jgi:hypothetical protein
MRQPTMRLRRLLSAASMLGLALSSAPSAMAQNLVSNGGFDNGLEGWLILPEGTAVASALDIDGNPASGSAQITNGEAAAEFRVYSLRRCLQLTQAGLHQVGASGFIAAGVTTGQMVFSFNVRASPDCTGDLSSAGGRFLDQPGTWETADFTFMASAPPSSIELVLGLEKAPAGGSVTGNIDNVYVMRDPQLFRNGFE